MTLHVRWLVVPIAIATFFAGVYGVRDVVADQAMKRAATTADFSTALEGGRRSDAPSSRLDTRVVRRRALAQRGDALTDVDLAIDRVQQGLDRSPKDPALRDLYGGLLTERAARSQLPDDIALARRELARLVAYAPHDPMLLNDQVTADSLHPIGKP